FELCSVYAGILTSVKLLRDTEKSRGAKHPCGCINASILAPQSHRKHKATGIIIHKLAASLFKPRGSKRGEKVAAYSPEITVTVLLIWNIAVFLSLLRGSHCDFST